MCFELICYKGLVVNARHAQYLVVGIIIELGLLKCVIVLGFTLGFTVGSRLIRESGCAGTALAITTAASLASVCFAFGLPSLILWTRWMVILKVDVTAAIAA